jgi:hypothetical protein
MKQKPVWHERVRKAQLIYRSMETGDAGAVAKAGRGSLQWFTSQRAVLRESPGATVADLEEFDRVTRLAEKILDRLEI